jgi:hypothetical protein
MPQKQVADIGSLLERIECAFEEVSGIDLMKEYVEMALAKGIPRWR